MASNLVCLTPAMSVDLIKDVTFPYKTILCSSAMRSSPFDKMNKHGPQLRRLLTVRGVKFWKSCNRDIEGKKRN